VLIGMRVGVSLQLRLALPKSGGAQTLVAKWIPAFARVTNSFRWLQ